MKLKSLILTGVIWIFVYSIGGMKGEVRSTPKSPGKFIYIQSAPPQLNVYLIPDSLIPDKIAEGEKSWDEKQEYLKGRTPLRVELIAGDYHVAVVCDENQLEKLGVAPQKGSLNSRAGKMVYGGCERQFTRYSIDEKSGFKVTFINHYSISKKEGQPLALTALLADENVSYEKLVSLLTKPAAFKYVFDEKQWAPPVAEYGIGQNTIAAAMALLHRTGIIPFSNGALILNDGKVQFITQSMGDNNKIEKLLTPLDAAGFQLKIF